jgi:hypothetical protein
MGTGAGAEAHHAHWGPNLDPRRSIILNPAVGRLDGSLLIVCRARVASNRHETWERTPGLV